MNDENRNENNTTQYNLNNYKKYIFILLFLIGLSSFILFININKYKCGYFIEGTNLKYNHYKGYNNVFRLDDNNIFILGENGIPSELYDIKTNTVKEIIFPPNLFYWSDGILLKNNRLLLTNAHITNSNKKIVPYGSIIILNLNNMQIEKIIAKYINVTKEPKRLTMAYLLSDNQIFMYQYGKVEIIDIDSGTSTIINDVNIPDGKFIPIQDNKVLIFANSNKKNQNKFFYDSIYEFDIKTKKLILINQIEPRDYPLIKKINSNEIVILGSRTPKDNNKIIEIYNINKNKSKKISNLILNRCTYENSLNIEMFDKNKLLITGGRCGMNLIFIPTLNSKNPMKQSEILNLETNDNILGPISKYFIYGSSMVALKNGDIFISNSTGNNLSKKVQIFRKGNST